MHAPKYNHLLRAQYNKGAKTTVMMPSGMMLLLRLIMCSKKRGQREGPVEAGSDADIRISYPRTDVDDKSLFIRYFHLSSLTVPPCRPHLSGLTGKNQIQCRGTSSRDRGAISNISSSTVMLLLLRSNNGEHLNKASGGLSPSQPKHLDGSLSPCLDVGLTIWFKATTDASAELIEGITHPLHRITLFPLINRTTRLPLRHRILAVDTTVGIGIKAGEDSKAGEDPKAGQVIKVEEDIRVEGEEDTAGMQDTSHRLELLRKPATRRQGRDSDRRMKRRMGSMRLTEPHLVRREFTLCDQP